MCIVIAAGHSGGLFFCAAGFSVSTFWLSLYHIKKTHHSHNYGNDVFSLFYSFHRIYRIKAETISLF